MTNMLIVTYVPAGYVLRDRQEGALVLGFGGVDGQVALSYSQSRALSDLVFPLTVHLGPPASPPLACTENRPGVPISFGGRSGIHHDGWWAPGPGNDEQRLPDGSVFHWSRENVHSVTVQTPTATLAVRGSRTRGINVDELRRVAGSVSVE